MHALILVSIFQMSWNVCKLFIPDIARAVIKNDIHKANGWATEMHKSFPMQYVLRVEVFKTYFEHIYIALNFKLMYVIQIYRNVFLIKKMVQIV